MVWLHFFSRLRFSLFVLVNSTALSSLESLVITAIRVFPFFHTCSVSHVCCGKNFRIQINAWLKFGLWRMFTWIMQSIHKIRKVQYFPFSLFVCCKSEKEIANRVCELMEDYARIREFVSHFFCPFLVFYCVAFRCCCCCCCCLLSFSLSAFVPPSFNLFCYSDGFFLHHRHTTVRAIYELYQW